MIARLPVTDGLAALLEELTGFPVGRRTIPLDKQGHPVPPPYTILDPIDGADDTHTLADNNTAVVFGYQATFVSGPAPNDPDSRGGDEQAQWMTDRGWKVVQRPIDGSPGYAHPINAGTGVVCWHREAREAGGTSDPKDAIITSVIRYRLFLEEQPAG